MLRVNLHSIDAELLDIIDYVKSNNRFDSAWGISFCPTEQGRDNIYLETKDSQIVNIIIEKWPQAEVINTLYKEA